MASLTIGVLVFLSVAIASSEANPVIIKANHPSTKAVGEEYRLNNDVSPISYEVHLTVNDDFATTKLFQGTIRINLRVDTESQNPIKIHVDSELIPTGADWIHLYNSDDETAPPMELQYLIIPDIEMIQLTPDRPLLTTGSYHIAAQFQGVLREDMYGFYLSSYAEDEITQWIATTQFQPTHARKAFPCFDEPHLKATFDIQITHPSTFHVLGNTEGTRSDPQNGIVTTTFARTPVMPTYLIAFIMSKFASMQVQVDSLGNGIWSRRETVATGKYGFDMAPQILRVMEGYTGIPYSESGLTKLDQVAIPDFSAGAMENWGLVTYRETALLWDPLESTARSKQRVGTVVAHELAHMWFGNLITTHWWDTTWLNEGFARFFEYRATAQVETDWELDNQFVVEQHQTILDTDANINTPALTSPAYSPDEISGRFLSITYSKGGSVIRMMEHFIGTENFFNGIKTYIGEDHFNTRTPADLFNAMQQHSASAGLPDGVTIEQIMTGWTEQSGFPLVQVTSNNQQISLAQSRFLYAGTEQTPTTWYIPISYATTNSPDFGTTAPKQWLQPNQALTIQNVLPNEQSWIVLNVQSSAYIRVNYDDRLWNNIITALNTQPNFGNIHVLNRAQLVDDAMNLARANKITYERAFDVLSFLENEVNYYPWYSAFTALTYLRRRFEIGGQVAQQLGTFVSHLMATLYADVVLNQNSRNQVDIHKRVLAQSWACDLEFEECIQAAQDSFNDLQNDDIPVNPDLRSTVYCTAIRHSTDRVNWDYLWNKYLNTDLASEQTLILSALGCTENQIILEEYLAKSIDPASGVRKQDAQSVFSSVISGSRIGVDIGLTFLIDNPDAIRENYAAMNALASVISGVASRLTNQQQVDSFQAFFEDTLDPYIQQQEQSAMSTANANLNWISEHTEDILNYLTEKNNENSTPDPNSSSVSSSQRPPSSNPTTSPNPTTPDSSTSLSASFFTLVLSIFVARSYSLW